MSTTYLTGNHSDASFYLNRFTGGPSVNYKNAQSENSTQHKLVDEGLLMTGVYCFMVPSMFLFAAMGLKYLEMSDLIANGLYISGAALIARIATANIIKKMAAEKNRNQAVWITIAMIAPSVSLILMSFFGSVTKTDMQSQRSYKNEGIATINHYSGALEIQIPLQSQAM